MTADVLMPNVQLLVGLEGILVGHRVFGDSDYIRGQMHDWFKRRLEIVSDQIPSAGRLLDHISKLDRYDTYKVLGDTVVRCAIQHAYAQLETGVRYGLPLSQCEELFDITTVHLESAEPRSPLERGVVEIDRLGSEPHHGWIWTEEHADDAFGKAFRSLMHIYDVGLCTPSAEEVAGLREGERLLSELLPSLSLSALSHTHLIAVFPSMGRWESSRSFSQFDLVGTIFLSRELLNDPWGVAEQLLHESLHQKLYDFRYGHFVFDQSRRRHGQTTICAPWNSYDSLNSNYWDVLRVFAAFHVYVHLALFHARARHWLSELEGRAVSRSPWEAEKKFRTSLDRAHYLGERLRDTGWEELGPAGKAFHEWLTNLLKILDPSPPPKGSDIQLSIDLYQKEANRVASMAGALDPQELTELIMTEVQETRSLVSALRGPGPDLLEPLNVTISEILASADAPEDRFSRVRMVIAEAFFDLFVNRPLSSEPFRDSRNAADDASKMIQRSSARLSMMASDSPGS